VDDADGVRGREGVGDLRPELGGLRPERRAAADVVREARAADELHDEVVPALGELAEVDRADDVRVLDLRGRHGLAGEAGDVLRLVRDARADGLEGDVLVQLQVLRQVHRAHATLAEDLEDAVASVDHAADPRPWLSAADCGQEGLRAGQRCPRSRGRPVYPAATAACSP
jgi:hypothetical protein